MYTILTKGREEGMPGVGGLGALGEGAGSGRGSSERGAGS